MSLCPRIQTCVTRFLSQRLNLHSAGPGERQNRSSVSCIKLHPADDRSFYLSGEDPRFCKRWVNLSGEDPRFCKRWVNQYPACLSGGSQSPTEINALRGRKAKTARIRLGIMSAAADSSNDDFGAAGTHEKNRPRKPKRSVFTDSDLKTAAGLTKRHRDRSAGPGRYVCSAGSRRNSPRKGCPPQERTREVSWTMPRY